MKLLIEQINRFHKLTTVLNRHWLWNGSKTQRTGHGRITVNGKTILLHRYIFCLIHNKNYNDNTFQVNHICKYSNCWSPLCLYGGSQSDNTLDMVRDRVHNHGSKSYCSKGHLLNGVTFSSRDGKVRTCKECNRIKGIEHYRRNRDKINRGRRMSV